MATIVLESKKVIEAARLTIAKIDAYRTSVDEERILKEMQGCTIFGYTFFTKTKKQAIKYLTENDSWFFPSIYAWGDYQKAKSLLKLAQQGDPVTLTEDDVNVLF